MTLRCEDGGPMRRCITPGCQVGPYPGKFCSDCEQATIPLRDWRNAKDVAERYEASTQAYRFHLPESGRRERPEPPDKAA